MEQSYDDDDETIQKECDVWEENEMILTINLSTYTNQINWLNQLNPKPYSNVQTIFNWQNVIVALGAPIPMILHNQNTSFFAVTRIILFLFCFF